MNRKHGIGLSLVALVAGGCALTESGGSEPNRSAVASTSTSCTYSSEVEVPARLTSEAIEGAPDCAAGDYLLPEGTCRQNGALCTTGHFRECLEKSGDGRERALQGGPYDAWVCECDETWACWVHGLAGSPCGDPDADASIELLDGANCPRYHEFLPADAGSP